MKNTIKINTSYVSSAEESLKSLSKSLKPYEKMLDSFSSSLSIIMNSYSTVSQSELKGVVESMQKAMNTSYLKSGLLTDSISNSLRELEKTFKVYGQSQVSKSLKAIAETMSLYSNSITSEQLSKLQQIDYSELFANIMPQSSSLSQILDTTYCTVQDKVLQDNERNENFTEEEVREAFQEQMSNTEGFQERVAGWTEKKRIQYFIIWQLICFIYGNFLQPYFQENVGIPVTAYVASNVKELPQKGADILCQLKEDVEAIIIEDTNYYYKVSFFDENGKKKEGYVAKRNLRKIGEKIDEETKEQQK